MFSTFSAVILTFWILYSAILSLLVILTLGAISSKTILLFRFSASFWISFFDFSFFGSIFGYFLVFGLCITMSYPCGKWGGECIFDVVLCDSCDVWFHYRCENLLKKQFTEITRKQNTAVD